MYLWPHPRFEGVSLRTGSGLGGSGPPTVHSQPIFAPKVGPRPGWQALSAREQTRTHFCASVLFLINSSSGSFGIVESLDNKLTKSSSHAVFMKF